MSTAAPSLPPEPHCLLIGAGIVGAATALQLQQRGFRVTLVDPRPPGTATSFGNAGGIVTGAAVPTATPGLWRSVPRMLLDPMSPLKIRWSYLPRFAPWMLRFLEASRPSRVERIARDLSALSNPAYRAHRPLLKLAGAEELVRPVGWLKLYRSQASFDATAADQALMRANDSAFEVLSPEEVRQLEPGIAPDFAGGILSSEAASCRDPGGLAQAYAGAVLRNGGRILQERVESIERPDGERRVVVTDQGRHEADLVVLAAGAWSARLARQWGERIPLDTERGYHLNLEPENDVELRRPTYFVDEGFVLAPMADGIRLTSGVEFAGIEAAPDYRRIRRLLPRAQTLLPGLGEQVTREWMGWRPSTPDSLPVIGRSAHDPRIIHAFGHGHLGLTLSAITGDLVARIAAGQPSDIDITPYAARRFSGARG
ncbi:NAD(P)/FAD-dependent oxidoreductase [Aquibaculum arenosum]|uniref:FAD-dependent oxidoreductase n=1 Tax=Aquibaculum arenosum TaxID=3032591 RepID=A0ABT5YQ62_9PROT|nr:FAD-dependent oxidoreductase [Fodinicurvata sp. CAU 1616]MDF2097034.1 FAD-dependent oxidoreductase [Fodinicurvata sp. CAU 1616]